MIASQHASEVGEKEELADPQKLEVTDAESGKLLWSRISGMLRFTMSMY